MDNHRSLYFLFAIALGFIFTADDAYALSTSNVALFNLGWAIQDLHENFVGLFSSEAKKDLIAKHLSEVQLKKEMGDSSPETTNRFIEKKQVLDAGVKPSVSELVLEVTTSGELGKINQLHNMFLDFRNTWNTEHVIPSYDQLSNFNKNINNLSIAKKYCQPLNGLDMIKAVEPYDDYLIKQCPPLQDVSKGFVRSVFDGANI